MATQDIDIIGNAITATEKEIAGAAWDDEERFALDETGDRSQEGMGDGLEGQQEDDEDDERGVETEEEELPEGETQAEVREPEGEKPPVQAEGKDGKLQGEPAKPEDKTNGRVPPAVHRQAAERARAAEAERETLRTALETERRERAAERARIEGYLLAQRQQQPPQQRQQQPQVPDMFEDPQGYHDYMRREFQGELAARDQRLDNMRVENSMMLAHRLNKDVFEKAFGSLTQLDSNNPDARALVQRIYGSPDPGEALIEWHKRNETLREVGNDPAAYKERLATETREALMKDPEFRRQLLDDLRAEANGSNNGGQQRTVTRLPKSLNGVPGGSSTRGEDQSLYDDSDRSVFSNAFRD
jgi:hypothetical protein